MRPSFLLKILVSWLMNRLLENNRFEKTDFVFKNLALRFGPTNKSLPLA